jgi:hypothetical protein
MRASSRVKSVPLLAVALCVFLCSASLGSEVEGQGVCQAEVRSAQQAGQAGMWAYFDPKTGKVGAPPPEAVGAAAAEPSAASTSGQGLVAVPAPGGGEMIDLQGRFNMAVTARLKPEGTVETDCHPSAASPAEAGGH